MEITEKAATNILLNRLVSILDTGNNYGKHSVHAIFEQMGEEVSTIDVIDGLINALEDPDSFVRLKTCAALGKLGRKTATDKVINSLVPALRDKDSNVRQLACKALSSMGEKAANKKVINALIIALGDQQGGVREKADEVLRHMVEKVEINEMIYALLSAPPHDYWSRAVMIIEKILTVSPYISDIQSDTVLRLSERFDDWSLNSWENKYLDKFSGAFLDTGISFWLPIIKVIPIAQTLDITIYKNNIVVYGNEEPVHLCHITEEQSQQLHDYFANWMEE